jgi:hypothetical protein
MGVSVRRLHGWEPTVRTTYEYDEQGRVSVSTETRDSEFTANELAVLLLSRLEENKRGPHGISMDVATDPANKGKFVPEATIDFAQAALDALQEDFREKYKHQKMHGYRFSVTLPDQDRATS